MSYATSIRLLLSGISVLVLSVCLSWRIGEAKTFELINGDKISGTVVNHTTDEVTLDHPILGRLVIPVQTLKHAETNPGLFGSPLFDGWDKELDLSLLGTRGNSDDGNLSIGMNFRYADDERRWTIRGQYSLSDSDGDIDTNEGHIDSDRDWLFANSRWFAFTLGRYDYDQFESWKHRLYWGGGPGYRFFLKKPFTLDGRFALGGGYEFGNKHRFIPLALLGLEGVWQISEVHSLRVSNQVIPHLNAPEVLNRTTAEWKIRLSQADGVSLKLGVHNDYNTDADDEKNNLKYSGALSFDF